MLEFCKMLGELTGFLINIAADFWNVEHFFLCLLLFINDW